MRLRIEPTQIIKKLKKNSKKTLLKKLSFLIDYYSFEKNKF